MTFSLSNILQILRRFGLVLGPVAALLLYFSLPNHYVGLTGERATFAPAGQATLAVMLWMAVWWLTEPVHITVTALLPLALFPLFGVATMTSAAAPYANPMIFLFMGGFLLAISMQYWGLGTRIALMTLRSVGTRPRQMVGGFMAVTAVLSAFVSNTATAAMMLPIAISVIVLVSNQHRSATPGEATDGQDTFGRNFAVCLMLGIAYAASIGGIATIIGTPPNVFLVGFLRNTIDPAYRMELSFAQWLLIGVPFAAIFLPLTWFLLTRVLCPIHGKPIPGGKDLILRQLKQLGLPNAGEWTTFIVFLFAAFFWIAQPWLKELNLAWGGHAFQPFANLSDPMIAIGAALLLFVIPSRSERQPFVLVWENAKDIPWGVLLLFGGGLSLADAVAKNGVAEFFGAQATHFAAVPTFLLIVLVAVGMTFLTELTSNTATTATLLPVLAGMAPGLGIHPYALVFPATIAASCAFMLPVATPPNAIVFGSGRVTLIQMAKAGLWLNLIGVGLISILTWLVIIPLMGAG